MFLILLGIYSGVELLHPIVPFLLNLLRSCQTVSKSSCTTLRSHWQCMGLPISPHSPQHLFFVVFVINHLVFENRKMKLGGF